MNNISINVYENFLSQDEMNQVLDYCELSPYFYGEKDTADSPRVTGMIHEIYSNHNDMNDYQRRIFDIFIPKIENQFDELIKDLSLYRMYINFFAPSENPYFHTDGKSGEITFLYYANEIWNVDDSGETQLFVDNILYGIPPIPNRLIYFDASILHKATSFRDRHRFTIALKYGIPRDSFETVT